MLDPHAGVGEARAERGQRVADRGLGAAAGMVLQQQHVHCPTGAAVQLAPCSEQQLGRAGQVFDGDLEGGRDVGTRTANGPDYDRWVR